MTAKISELNQVELAIVSSDIDTADVTSTVFYDASKFKTLYALAKTATSLTNGKKLTLTLMQATDSAGTSAKAIGSAVEYTSSGTTKGEISVDSSVDALDSANGFTYVGVKVGSDLGSAVVASVALVLGTPRFAPVA